MASYFSVTLFVLLGGITSELSAQRNIMSIEYVKKRFLKLMCPYLLAVAVFSVITTGKLDMGTYLNSLINFTGLFYFVLFYIQLCLISPILHMIISRIFECQGRIRKMLECSILIILAFSISKWTTQNTNIFEVYGGGRYLLGGSYFFIFVIGMLLGKLKLNIKIKNTYLFVMGIFVSGIVWAGWMTFIIKDQFKLDMRYLPIWTTNPPGISLFIYAIFTLVFYGGIFLFMEYMLGNFGRNIAGTIGNLGKYTMDIFFYHLLWISVLYSRLSCIIKNAIIIKSITFICAIAGPILVKKAYLYIKKQLLK